MDTGDRKRDLSSGAGSEITLRHMADDIVHDDPHPIEPNQNSDGVYGDWDKDTEILVDPVIQASCKGWVMLPAILSLLCFFPFSIIAIYYAATARKAFAAGDHVEGCHRTRSSQYYTLASLVAGMWCLVGAAALTVAYIFT